MNIGHILRTITGFYNKPYNKQWDAKLNEILDSVDHGAKVILGDARITVDEYEIWIENKYYCYAHAWRINGIYTPKHLQFRPKFSTMKRLDKLVQEIKAKEIQEGAERLYGKSSK